MRHEITGFTNPTVKWLRSLRDKKHRKRERRFLAEGLRLLADAHHAGHVPEMLVMAKTRNHHALLDELEEAVSNAGGEIIETSHDILAKISGKDNPQAVCGVFAEFDTSLETIDAAISPIWLVAQALRDPGNLGTILRTGDAVGAGGIILLDDTVDPFSVEVVRASMGAIFTQRIAQAEGQVFIDWLRAQPVSPQLVAASLRDAVPYRDATYHSPCFIMVGNESRGLPENYEEACDLRVTMPMKGRADSLNAAVAAAVLAYEVLARIGDVIPTAEELDSSAVG